MMHLKGFMALNGLVEKESAIDKAKRKLHGKLASGRPKQGRSPTFSSGSGHFALASHLLVRHPRSTAIALVSS
jgi:hypothetical protein